MLIVFNSNFFNYNNTKKDINEGIKNFNFLYSEFNDLSIDKY